MGPLEYMCDFGNNGNNQFIARAMGNLTNVEKAIVGCSRGKVKTTPSQDIIIFSSSSKYVRVKNEDIESSVFVQHAPSENLCSLLAECIGTTSSYQRHTILASEKLVLELAVITDATCVKCAPKISSCSIFRVTLRKVLVIAGHFS